MKILDLYGLIEKLDVSFSEFKDPRDGKIYPTVKINGIEWFRENLNFDDTEEFGYAGLIKDVFDVDMPSMEASQECGRLYSFSSAQEACPEGWKIPERSDFIDLFKAITGKDPNEWKNPEKAMIFHTFCGKSSIMNVKQCGRFDYPNWQPSTEKRAKKMLSETGLAFLFTSTPGAMTSGGAVFYFKSSDQSYAEDVKYGYYPVRPIKKNI